MNMLRAHIFHTFRHYFVYFVHNTSAASDVGSSFICLIREKRLLILGVDRMKCEMFAHARATPTNIFFHFHFHFNRYKLSMNCRLTSTIGADFANFTFVKFSKFPMNKTTYTIHKSVLCTCQ